MNNFIYIIIVVVVFSVIKFGLGLQAGKGEEGKSIPFLVGIVIELLIIWNLLK